MDHQKFRRSADVGFARRHGKIKPDSVVPYELDRGGLKFGKWKERPAILGTVKTEDGSRIPLKVIVMVYDDDIFRIVFEDAHPPSTQRYVLDGILLEEDFEITTDQIDFQYSDEYASAMLGGSGKVIRMRYKPFDVDVLDCNGQVLCAINSGSKLLLENFLKKSEVDSSFVVDGHWEEEHNGFTDRKPRGPESAGVDISMPFASDMCGIPERAMPLSLPDTVDKEGNPLSEPYRLYNLDVSFFELNEPFGLYGTVPLLYGRNNKKAVGVFWHNTSETYVDLCSSDNGRTSHWYSESGLPDIFVLTGPSPSSVFMQYLRLTGLPTMPPRFSLGYHQCRYSYMTQKDALSVNSKFNEHDIPYDVLWLDIDHTNEKRYFTWDGESFPSPQHMISTLASHGRRAVTIVDPHIKVDPRYTVHNVATDTNLYVKDPSGDDYIGDCWAGNSSYFDYLLPKARVMWGNFFSSSMYSHFSNTVHIWNDMNEPSVFDGPEGTFPKTLIQGANVEHRHVHNMYGHLMTKATYGGMRKREVRPFLLTRSFFAGTQRYALVWTGDNTGTWEHLRSTTDMILALQVCGMIMSGADVGGFFEDAEEELRVRWYQMAVWHPFFRGHSFKGSKRCEPWLFGREWMVLMRAAIRVRYEWMPLWYTLLAGACLGKKWGGPMIRPVWWEFGGDQNDSNGWMVGGELYVAPVMEKGVEKHTVKLPEGSWFELYGKEVGRKVNGVIERPCAIDSQFAFLREGRIVTKVDKLEGVMSTKELKKRPIVVVVGVNEEGKASGKLWMDDGETWAFEKGKYGEMSLEWSEGVLQGKRIEGEGEIEGIVGTVMVFGVEKVRRVLVNDEKRRFEWDEKLNKLIVRDLKLQVGAEWSLAVYDS